MNWDKFFVIAGGLGIAVMKSDKPLEVASLAGRRCLDDDFDALESDGLTLPGLCFRPEYEV